MTADEIVRALGGIWCGRNAIARCPVEGHGRGRRDVNPSLSIAKGEGDRAMVHCFAGCSAEAIFGALQSSGPALTPCSRLDNHPLRPPRRDGRRAAEEMWRRATPIADTIAATYLAARGVCSMSSALRFLPNARHPHAPGHMFPALLAAVTDNTSQVCAVQRTYLTPRGDKADVNPVRMTLGSLEHGAVRLAPSGAALGLAEGLETSLAASRLFDIPVWSACGTRLARIDIPSQVMTVVVFADHDAAGTDAAQKAARVFRASGRHVQVLRPRRPGADWNDVLFAQAFDHEIG